MLGAALGIPVTLVVPESASEERKRTLAAYGANVVYSDPYEGSDGAIALSAIWWRAQSVATSMRINTTTRRTSPRTTRPGPEIWNQTAGQLTHFVAALGTTGTIMGAGRFFRERGELN
jgi:cysteine synthase B